ncbi:MAG: tRNA (adenosine(37)-N6)-dimethylallyltransferase MiaA, partial [Christensenellaceae bacterium]
HMIDVVDPDESFSVSDFETMALPVVERLRSEGKPPVLCGGTGFYLRSILYKSGFGLAKGDEAVRKKYELYAAEYGVDALHRRLEEVDPESAEKLHPNDTMRVIRALEIFELTGRRKSEQCDEPVARFPFHAFCIDYDRQSLYRRIDRRVDQMMEAGLVDEVKKLLCKIDESAQCMQGIGYKEIAQGLKNGDSPEAMSDIIKQRTRNYAKRQITFFKRMENLTHLRPDGQVADEVMKVLCQTESNL